MQERLNYLTLSSTVRLYVIGRAASENIGLKKNKVENFVCFHFSVILD